MRLCFLIFSNFILISLSEAVTKETDIPFQPFSNETDSTTWAPDSSSNFPDSSPTTTPDFPTDSTSSGSSYYPTDSTRWDSSNYPTDLTSSDYPTDSTASDSSFPSTDSTASDFSTDSDFSTYPTDLTATDSSFFPTDSTGSDSTYWPTDSTASASSNYPFDSTTSYFPSDSSNYPTDSTASDSSHYPTDLTASDFSTDSTASGSSSYPTDSTAYDYSTISTTSFSPSESTPSDSSSHPTDSTSSDFSTDSTASDSSYFPTDSTVSVFPTDSTSSDSSNNPTDSTTSDSSNYPTDATASDSSTDSSAFPTESDSPTTYSSSLKPTPPTTPPPPPPHNIVHPKRKHPILQKQKPKKISNFKDDDSVECKSSTLTADYRQQILDAHNEFRSTLANGMAELPDGKFAPPASNMYKLKYSCKLEAMAQKWTNQEIFQYNENQKIIPGENLYLKWSQKDNLEDDAINETSISWWNELSQNGLISETNVTLTKEMMNSIGHWSQMAWSSTEFIGCGFKKFKKQNEPDRFYYLTVCNYFPAGNILGMKIYEIGNPCKKDSECSEKPKSICDVDTGLCYAN